MANQLLNLANSRAIRSAVSRVRTVSVNPTSADGDRNFWGRVGSTIAKFVGSLISKICSWKLSDIWGGIVQVASFIMNFNWNQTDAETDAQIDQAFVRISSLAGQAVGSALGKLVCGALPAAALLQLNPTMGKYVLKEVTEELIEEMARELLIIAKGVTSNLVNAGALWIFQNVRRFIKGGSDKEFKAKLQKAGLKADEIEKRIQERNKPFVIRQKIEEKIESIPNKYLKAFVEEAFEEFGESCTEAGYVLAGAIDGYNAQKNMNSSDATVEISFDDNNQPVIRQL